jgi:hypothetical protein
MSAETVGDYLFPVPGWAGEDDPAAPKVEPVPPSPAELEPPSELDFVADLLALSIHGLIDLYTDGNGEVRAVYRPDGGEL